MLILRKMIKKLTLASTYLCLIEQSCLAYPLLVVIANTKNAVNDIFKSDVMNILGHYHQFADGFKLQLLLTLETKL